MNSTYSAIKINWLDKQIWKQCFVSTFICLTGCSIGAMGSAFYFINYNWPFVLLISLIAGLITCMIFMIIWNMMFRQMNFKNSFESSYKMSIVSMLIMILSENCIIIFIVPNFSSHQMHMNKVYDFGIMPLAMSLGFLLSLPYNYYQLQKIGKTCH